MKRNVLFVLGLLTLSTTTFTQTQDEAIERALAPAPRQMREAATVIKWKADSTYDTLRKGTNQLVCYERSGEPGYAAFSAQCTSLANLPRVAQNRKFDAMDKAAKAAALEAAEKDGSRVKPEYGSVWLTMNGTDRASATRVHTTIAVPGATTQSIGLPDNNKLGGAWIMNAGTSTAHIMTPGS